MLINILTVVRIPLVLQLEIHQVPAGGSPSHVLTVSLLYPYHVLVCSSLSQWLLSLPCWLHWPAAPSINLFLSLALCFSKIKEKARM